MKDLNVLENDARLLVIGIDLFYGSPGYPMRCIITHIECFFDQFNLTIYLYIDGIWEKNNIIVTADILENLLVNNEVVYRECDGALTYISRYRDSGDTPVLQTTPIFLPYTFKNAYEHISDFKIILNSFDYTIIYDGIDKETFMNIIYSNFYFIYNHVCKFGLDYDSCDVFIRGYTTVKLADKWGAIDKDGKEVIKPQYEWLGRFNEDGWASFDIYDGDGITLYTGKVYLDGTEKDRVISHLSCD